MPVVKRVTQIYEVKIPNLVLMAKSKGGATTEIEIAKWIISASPYWRGQGYHKIVAEMNRV